MKISAEIIIDADRKTVWKTFDNPENIVKWQPTLISFVHKSGEPRQPGAVSERTYLKNGREFRMVECITERREPFFIAGTYESKWGTAIIVNHFDDTKEGKTRWASYWNYTYTGFSRFMVPFMRRKMCAHIDDEMHRFKILVETQISG